MKKVNDDYPCDHCTGMGNGNCECEAHQKYWRRKAIEEDRKREKLHRPEWY